MRTTSSHPSFRTRRTSPVSSWHPYQASFVESPTSCNSHVDPGMAGKSAHVGASVIPSDSISCSWSDDTWTHWACSAVALDSPIEEWPRGLRLQTRRRARGCSQSAPRSVWPWPSQPLPRPFRQARLGAASDTIAACWTLEHDLTPRAINVKKLS